MRRYLFLLSMSLLPAVSCLAETYYVSTHGADTNHGLNADAAFAHHPWDTLATDTADATTLTPGDIVYMKRGHIWYNCSLNVEDSGGSGNPIITTTLDGFGFGDDPKLVGAYDPSKLSFVPSGGSYRTRGIATEPRIVVYNGTGYNWRILKKRDMAWNAVGPGEWDWDENQGEKVLWVNVGEDPAAGTMWIARRNVVALVSGCSDVAFSNLDFCVSQNGSYGAVYITSSSRHITLEGCGCAYGNAGLYMRDSSALTIRDCRVWGWTESAGIFGNNCAASSIIGCLIDGDDMHGIGIRLHNSSTNMIQACHFQNCWNGLEYGLGGDGSGITISGDTGGSNSVIANTFVGCYAGVILKSTSGMGDNALGYNFIVNSHVNGISITSSGGLLPELVYRNTVIHNPSDHDPTADVDYTGHGIAIQSTGTAAIFNGNTIFVSRSGNGCDNCNGLCISDTNKNIVEVRTDYNVLFGVRDAHLAKLVGAGGTQLYQTVRAWQNAIQAETNILDLDGVSSAAGSHDTGADTVWTRPAEDVQRYWLGLPAVNAGASVFNGLTHRPHGTGLWPE